jgi:1-acyl-sn-glycerol-3-phosphate acyltransferase
VGAVKETIHRLREGHVLNIYPEGTRSKDGQIMALEKGVGVVIRRARVPVVPAVVDGAHRAWGRSMKYPRATPVRVMYGPPMDMEGLGRDEAVAKLEQTLHLMLADLRAGKIVKDPPREKGR